MEYLKQVNPDEWEQTPPLVELYNILPKTLRCSPHKNNTDFRRKTPHQATKNAYIGYNTPNVTSVIVIDLDYKDSKFAYSDLGLPRPQFITENKKILIVSISSYLKTLLLSSRTQETPQYAY